MCLGILYSMERLKRHASMKKLLPQLVIIALTVILISQPGEVAGHSIGIDLIRLVDENQDGGMMNIHGQVGISGDSALSLGYARGDDMTIIDAGLKYYFGRYMASPFVQLGVGYFDHDLGNDVGFIGLFGLEGRVARHIGFSSAVKMTAGVDRKFFYHTASPVFHAVFSLMVVFPR